jgi:hypothetical protein
MVFPAKVFRAAERSLVEVASSEALHAITPAF